MARRRWQRRVVWSLLFAGAFVVSGAVVPALFGMNAPADDDPRTGNTVLGGHYDRVHGSWYGTINSNAVADVAFLVDRDPDILVMDFNIYHSELDSPRSKSLRNSFRLVKDPDLFSWHVVWRFGWPKRAWYSTYTPQWLQPPIHRRVLRFAPLANPMSPTTIGDRWARADVPYGPIPSGIAINLAFGFVSCLALLSFATAARRRLRTHRGLCAACGYDLAGVSRCPECGELVIT